MCQMINYTDELLRIMYSIMRDVPNRNVSMVHSLFTRIFGLTWPSSPQICTPDLVVFLSCSNQRLKERLMNRAEQQGRPDDNLKATQRRLMNFKQNAIPLIRFFQERGLIVTVRFQSIYTRAFLSTTYAGVGF